MKERDTFDGTGWTPAVTQDSYEHDMAERLVVAAGTLRRANQACAQIQAGKVHHFFARKDPDWRKWDGMRGAAANEIVSLLRGMAKMGYDTSEAHLKELADWLCELYRGMLRDELAAIRTGQKKAGAFYPKVFIHEEWIKGLDLAETLAIAPVVWRNYRDQFRAA